MLFDRVDLSRVSDLAKVRSLYNTLLPAMGFTNVVEDADSICFYALLVTTRAAPFSGSTSIPTTGRTAPGSPCEAPRARRSTGFPSSPETPAP